MLKKNSKQNDPIRYPHIQKEIEGLSKVIGKTQIDLMLVDLTKKIVAIKKK